MPKKHLTNKKTSSTKQGTTLQNGNNNCNSKDKFASFDQTFKNLDVILHKDAGCSSELDYVEQTSWIFFLKYLNDLEKFGKGKNRGRTLIYNLAVLFYSIYNNYNAPRFIIHDGIFDGIDKLQFVDVVKFLNKQQEKGLKFQYIVALNEEGVLTDKLDPEKVAAHEKIIKEAILLLTPDKPLFKEHF